MRTSFGLELRACSVTLCYVFLVHGVMCARFLFLLFLFVLSCSGRFSFRVENLPRGGVMLRCAISLTSSQC